MLCLMGSVRLDCRRRKQGALAFRQRGSTERDGRCDPTSKMMAISTSSRHGRQMFPHIVVILIATIASVGPVKGLSAADASFR
jgi:hypothetical protein